MSRFNNPSFRPRGPVSARALQNLSDSNRRQRLWVAPPLELREIPMGTLLTVAPGGESPRIVKPTSTTPNGYGYLPGKLQDYKHGTGWSDGDDCHIVDANA